jgi:hypothetical protein
VSEPYVQFRISAGQISTVDQTGTQSYIRSAYSGAPGFVNDVSAERMVAQGPIPRGWWTIGADNGEKGPLTLPLTPDADTNTFGRSGFLIHGDNASRPPQSSSEGCIVADHQTRAICATFARLLVVA